MKEINGVINEAAKALPALPGNYCRCRPKVVVGVKVASLAATVLHRIVSCFSFGYNNITKVEIPGAALVKQCKVN